MSYLLWACMFNFKFFRINGQIRPLPNVYNVINLTNYVVDSGAHNELMHDYECTKEGRSKKSPRGLVKLQNFLTVVVLLLLAVNKMPVQQFLHNCYLNMYRNITYT